MRTFTALSKRFSVYALLLISTLAHLTSGHHGIPLNIGFICLLFSSPFLPTRLVERRAWLLSLNALTLGYLLFGLAQLVIIGVSPMDLASSFLLVLMTNKLLGPRRTRDRMQLILLSLLQMVIASALSSGLTLGFFLILYTITLPIGLTMLTMERNEELYADQRNEGATSALDQPKSKHRLTTILLGTGFAVLLGAILFFILIPRLGFGLFAPNHRGQSMTGFSSRVELGDFGRIKMNRKTVMRVRISGAAAKSKRPYWRGISLDRYEDGRWSKTFERKQEIRLPKRGFLNLERRFGAATDQEIFLEPLDETVLFGLSQISSISSCQNSSHSGSKIRYFKDIVGDLHYKAPRKQTLRYCVKSHEVRAKPVQSTLTMQAYKRHKKALSKTFQTVYFQVPQEVSETLETVLRKVTFRSDRVMEIIEDLERHLESNYRYTLDRKSDTSVQPITDFLLKEPEGHCEYFATAMILLLRQRGIAARLVNGFAGGHRNNFGEYLVVHQGNAHSWVEVFIPQEVCTTPEDCKLEGKWLTVDPTPGREQIPQAKSLMRDVIDALQLRWAEYVVRYNLRTQLSWMAKVFEWVMPASQDEPSRSEPRKRIGKKKKHTLSLTWFYWLACLALMFIAIQVWRQRKGGVPAQKHREITTLFGSVVRRYESFGIHRSADQTAREWLMEVEGQALSSQALVAFIETYEQYRFEPNEQDLNELKRLANLIPRVGRSKQ